MSETTGSIRGQVTDTEGGVLPGVVVRITKQEGEWERDVVTNAMGIFMVQLVPVGAYTLTATMEGFNTQRLENIIVEIGHMTDVDIQMHLASVEETL